MPYLAARTIAAAVALVPAAGASAATAPPVRQVASGVSNSPDRLAASPENPQVHHETGGAGYAHAVAAVLPAAVARIESVHGRPFARPVTIGVYMSEAAFAAGNGLGHARAAGVTFFGQVTLSPILFSTQRQRIPGILTHEMSHAHLQSWISAQAYIRLPNWFKEGLAVMASGGGGAEFVSDAEAREAIRRGDRIAVESEGSWRNPTGITFESVPEMPVGTRVMLGYRQAGLFVAFLRDKDAGGFAHMMGAVLDGRPFAEAVAAGYGTDLRTLWADFLRSSKPG
jgi:hypothetical protein